MRVAAVYDIHGNLPALEAVMAEIRSIGVDRVVVGGDVVPGPMAVETLRLLLDCGLLVEFICGNGEVAVLEVLAGGVPSAVPEQYWPGIRWSASAMAEYESLLRAWPKTCRVGEVLFCHATPRNENEIFTRLTEEWRSRLAGSGRRIDPRSCNSMRCGHCYVQ